MSNESEAETLTVDDRPKLQLTDTGNAQIFARIHAENVRYCYKSRKWYFWNGSHFTEDDIGEIQRKAKETVQRLFQYATNIQDPDRREQFVKHALKSQSDHRIRAMINLAQSEPGIPIKITGFDSDPWLLNVVNGTIDLKTGTLLPHCRDNLITKIVNVSFDPDATCPLWERFLFEIMAGDVELIRHLQKAIGYSLTGSNREQVIFIFYGPGANGKSTFIIIIHRLLNDYARKTPTETLLVKHGNGIPNDIARLNGARFVSADEAEHGRHMAEALVKRLTGGDKISARYLYGEYFEFEPTFKIFLDVNHKPNIRGADHAIWRRIQLIPFKVIIPADKRDKTLVSKLEAELPGILRWAVEGCLLWQKEGLKTPESVKRATHDYQSEMDVIGDFINECCELVDDAKTPFKHLYDKYELWAINSCEEIVDRKDFAIGLTDRGYTDGRNKQLGRYRKGLRLK